MAVAASPFPLNCFCDKIDSAAILNAKVRTNMTKPINADNMKATNKNKKPFENLYKISKGFIRNAFLLLNSNFSKSS